VDRLRIGQYGKKWCDRRDASQGRGGHYQGTRVKKHELPPLAAIEQLPDVAEQIHARP